MRLYRYWYILLFVSLWLSTSNSQDWQHLLGDRYEITAQSGNLATIRDKYTGREVVRLLEEAEKPSNGLSLDTLYADTTVVINLWEVDTSRYANRFYLMGTVPLAGFGQPLLIFDSNQSGINEIIGIHRKNFHLPLPRENRFYEYRQSGAFDSVVVFPSEEGGGARTGANLDNDGYREVLFKSGDSIRIYEASDSSEYATEFRYSFATGNATVAAGVSVRDFDKDGHNEILYVARVIDSTGGSIQGSEIREHMSGDTAYITTAFIPYPFTTGGAFGNYAIGDIDLDGRLEFYTGDVFGRVFGIENVANDSFRLHWQAQLPTMHAYYHFSAGDLDGDGLPEIFLGGARSDGNLLTALEMTGNDQYYPFWAVEIVGGNLLYTHRVVHGDIDGDGIDEFTVDVGGAVLTFKAVGDNEYELFWIKRGILWADGVAMGDVDGDGQSEIIITTTPINQFGYLYTQGYIYKFDSTAMGLPHSSPFIPNIIILYPNYPNPFNSSTIIVYELSKAQAIKLTVYDVVGKEVIRLVDDRQTAGNHLIKWNGKDQNGKEVSSGLYLVRLKGGEFSRTQKMILIR